MVSSLFDFIKFRPIQILVDKLVILYPNDDQIIGDINKQIYILDRIYSKPIDLISIPSYISFSDINSDDRPQICAHVMFKEKIDIIEDIYLNIKKYL